MVKIKYLDGSRWHRALMAGANNVLYRQEYLNKINVFPVPDGDTGTNMAFTLNSIIDSTSNKILPRCDDMLALIADAALDGARGNSGVILAQFFQGISEGAVDIKKMNPESFSKAIKFGAEHAKQALTEPKEGTILTVINDFSNHLINLIKKDIFDFEHLLQSSINEAEKSLRNTPNLLPILKKSGVVDAGAQGFVDLLNGIYTFIQKGNIKEFEKQTVINKESIKLGHENISAELSKYRFCTECLINGENINHKQIRKKLHNKGDSLVIAGNKIKTKIHIHVNNPSEIFKICRNFGIIKAEKADDMWKQYKTIQKNKSTKIAIVTDSGADIPENIDSDIHVVPVRYNFGNIGYIDKLSQTSEEFYQELATNPKHPKTSQPTPGDFRRQYEYLISHYNSIISIHLPHKMSGTYQSALNASKKVKQNSISVIDGLSASVGLGLIVLKVASMAQKGKTHIEITNALPNIIASTKIFLILKDLDYVVKGGRLPKIIKTLTDIIHIRPILTTRNDGSMGFAGIIKGTQNFPKKINKFLLNKINNNKKYNIAIGHCNTLEEGKKLKELINNNYENINSINLLDMGCALGVHAGPGSLSIAIQPEKTY